MEFKSAMTAIATSLAVAGGTVMNSLDTALSPILNTGTTSFFTSIDTAAGLMTLARSGFTFFIFLSS